MSYGRVASVLAAIFVGISFSARVSAAPGSVEFVANDAANYDYLRITDLPAGFGAGEFTLELWVLLDDSFPVGTTSGGLAQRQNWASENPQRYSSFSWWYAGNFLLDGHKNGSQNGGFESGTFSLQVFNGGRLRWTFGDGAAAAANPGELWGIQDPNSASLLDGQWHQVTLVRRWSGVSSADLEMWIDGVLIDSQTSSARTNMETSYWNNWNGFPNGQEGWFWGTEKQAANSPADQYEDYKGLLDEMRFWSRAKTATEIATNYASPVVGNEPGLVGLFGFGEAQGTSTCDALNSGRCMTFFNSPSGVWSPQNAPIGGATDTQAPTTPTNLQGTAVSSSRIDLTWSASSDNVGVSGYDVRRDGVVVATSANTSFSDTGLTANTSYVYTVSARDAAGNVSGASSSASISTLASTDTQAPTTPTNLQGTAVSSSRIDLTWSASSDNVGVSGYDVRRDGVVVATSANTSFSDTGLTANTSYVYTVSARDAAGNVSGASSSASISTLASTDTQAPTTPTNLQGTAVSSSRIDLTWSASSDNVGVSGYDVRRDGVVVATSANTSFSDTGLTANTSYVYTVSARDAAGNVSGASSSASISTLASTDTQAPTTPTNLQGTAVSSSRIDLTWSASSDNVGVSGYDVRRDGVVVATSANTSFSDTGLTANTSYVYTVSARDAAGNVSGASSSASISTLASTDTQAPTTPTNLQGTAVSSSRIDLTWSASSDNVGVSGYDVRRDGVVVATSANTSFSDTGLTANTSYVYTVSARDAAGNVSGASSSASISTLASTDTQAPTTPTNLQGTAVSSSRIDLTWSASSDNVGVSGYDVRRDGVVVATSANTSFSDTGLTANTSYVYTVSARDAAGNVSGASSSASISTLASTDTQAPTTPTNLQGTAVSSSRIDLTWSASSDNVGVSGYDVRRDGVVVATSANTSFSDTGLTANTSYVYTVSARDAAGNQSQQSTSASINTPAVAVASSGGGGATDVLSLIIMWLVFACVIRNRSGFASAQDCARIELPIEQQ